MGWRVAPIRFPTLLPPELIGDLGRRWNHLVGRHSAVLPREKRYREGIRREAQCAGEEILRKEVKEVEQLECWRHAHSHPGVAGKVRRVRDAGQEDPLTHMWKRSASMTTWGVQLTTLESRASEHEQFASALISNLADPLKAHAARYEELRKYHGEYATKLEKERDSTYADLRKMKGKYDSVCQEVENRRKKTESAFDHGKGKARVAFEQQQGEMRNVKVREAL